MTGWAGSSVAPATPAARAVAAAGGGFSGTPGLLRLFNTELGGQVSWFLPSAVVGLVAGLILRGRAARTDMRRAGYLMWGGWFVVTAAVFSLMSGIIHSYYTVALAPAIAALVGAGLVDLWALRKRSWIGGALLAVSLAVTAWLAVQLLGRSPDFVPGVDVVILAVALLVALIVALPHRVELDRLTLAAAGHRAGSPADRPGGIRHRHHEHGLLGWRPKRGPGRHGRIRRHPGRLRRGPAGRRRPGRRHPARQRQPGGWTARRWPRRRPHRLGRRRPGERPRRHPRSRSRRRGRRGRGLDTGRLPRREPRLGDLDRGRGLVDERGLDRARVGRAGHGHGRLQRRRPGAHAGAVQGARRLGPGAVTCSSTATAAGPEPRAVPATRRSAPSTRGPPRSGPWSSTGSSAGGTLYDLSGASTSGS